MPRIDPLQLLKCLSVLLTPEGGILSRDEVPRLVNLMTKFSKKLVSKCVYVLILKSTDTELVDLFMGVGGWTLIQTWLQDAVHTSNWDLVREILGLLLVTPVDVERLKLNILPKLIKSLSRREDLEGVAQLSTQLVQQWLMIVKGTAGQIQQQVQSQNQTQISQNDAQSVAIKTESEDKLLSNVIKTEVKDEVQTETGPGEGDNGIGINSFYKTTGKDGKLVIRKLSQDSVKKEDEGASSDDTEKSDDKKEVKDKDKNKTKSSKGGSSNKIRSREKDEKKSEKEVKREKDKEKEREKDTKKTSGSTSRSSNTSKHKSSSSSSRSRDDKDRDRHRDKGKDREKDKDQSKSKDSDKDRHKKNGTLKSSSNSSKSSKDKKEFRDKEREKEKGSHDKEKQIEKDNSTLEKLKPPTIDKLGRIPKKIQPAEDKLNENNLDNKKKSFSVGIRKDKENDERPKTVKVFNSKMRSTGLEEEVKPAPSRSTATNKKPTPSVQLPTIPQKRPSPPKDIREPTIPPEKKLKMDKIDAPERPGSIKLIPPKPKPVLLLESDLFIDALTAAATKKEPKKRKRRASVSKDSKDVPSSPTTSISSTGDQSQPSTSPQNTEHSPPLALKNIAPINFYQDTLTEESDEVKQLDEENKENEGETPENVSINEISIEEVKDTPSSPPKTPTDEQEDEPIEIKKPKFDGGLRGVLLYTKKKGPKKTITWKAESDLVEVRYFELDETERVNVSRNFGDMAKMELSGEREALQMRKISGEDLMEPMISWKVPYPIDLEEPLVPPGSKSKEKDIQFAREKSVLPALYFDRSRIPDNPEDPIPENHQIVDPLIIPLDDPESQEMDLRSTPWPEPKGNAPYQEPPQLHPSFGGDIPVPFNPMFSNINPPAFQGIPPRFPGPVNPLVPMGHMGPTNNFGPGNMNMMPNNIMGPPNLGPRPMEMMNMNPNIHPNMNPNMNPNINPNINPNMNPNMFPGGPMPDKYRSAQDFPIYNNQNPQNMNNMYQHQPQSPPNNFNNHRQNVRGGFRRGSHGGGHVGGGGHGGGGGHSGGGGGGGNSGNWVRSNQNNSWNNKRANSRGRICKNVQIHGYCRNIDTCAFVHP